ncbi:hypothetical protein CL617_03050 [archaeon]|nr:hypothetical protein [archaeon]|tara:strand:- start:18190 stop:18555 length:366 start_codon:yes stop_codon:yes gene_type:complete
METRYIDENGIERRVYTPSYRAEFSEDEENYNYIDEKGYERFIDGRDLVSRHLAFHGIYCLNPEIYTLNFNEYDVHHEDEDRLNNSMDNLQLLTEKEHKELHRKRNFDKFDYGCFSGNAII